MNLTQAQIESLVRGLLFSGGPAAAWLVAHNCDATVCQAALMTVIIWLIGVVPPAAAAVWGLIVHTVSNQVATVTQMPGVQKIIVGSGAGEALTAIVNDPTRPKVTTDGTLGGGVPNPTRTQPK
jgi:hypothetical protein